MNRTSGTNPETGMENVTYKQVSNYIANELGLDRKAIEQIIEKKLDQRGIQNIAEKYIDRLLHCSTNSHDSETIATKYIERLVREKFEAEMHTQAGHMLRGAVHDCTEKVFASAQAYAEHPVIVLTPELIEQAARNTRLAIAEKKNDPTESAAHRNAWNEGADRAIILFQSALTQLMDASVKTTMDTQSNKGGLGHE